MNRRLNGRKLESKDGRFVPVDPVSAGMIAAPRRSPPGAVPADPFFMPPGMLAPDWRTNVRLIGVPFWQPLQPHPLALAATVPPPGVIVASQLEVDDKYSYFVLAGEGMVVATSGGNTGVPFIHFPVDVYRENTGLQEQVDEDWVAFESIFGNGQYPHWYAIPLLMSASSMFNFQFRNQGTVNVNVFAQLLLQRVEVFAS